MTIDKKSRVGVLLGGLSEERDVSLRTGKGMATALRARGYQNVVELDVTFDIGQRLQNEKIEVAMVALHGRYGEDGTIQGLLEFLKIPYSGSGVLGSALAMDKVASKYAFLAHGVSTPPFIVARRGQPLASLSNEISKKLGFPAVAKPICGGSTIGLSLVTEVKQVGPAQSEALLYDDVVLWEKFIKGTELTVGFLNGKPLPLVEIVPKKGFFDYEAKYTKGMTEYFAPARVALEVVETSQAEAKKAFDAVHAESFGRVDLLWTEGKPWILEVNTIPGMTETSLLPKAAKASGITYEEMVESILLDSRLKVKTHV